MRTVQFPPICPFGDSEDDAVTVRRPSSRWVCWPVSDKHFLRLNVYEDGDVTYLLADRTEIQREFLSSVEDLDLEPVPADQLEKLRELKLKRIARRCAE
jgi:hypothetical protein